MKRCVRRVNGVMYEEIFREIGRITCVEICKDWCINEEKKSEDECIKKCEKECDEW